MFPQDLSFPIVFVCYVLSWSHRSGGEIAGKHSSEVRDCGKLNVIF